MNDGYSRFYIGAHLENPARERVVAYQNTMYKTLVQKGWTVRNIQRRLLCLPIIDTGVHQREANEILGLCLKRLKCESTTFSLNTSGIVVDTRRENQHYVSLKLIESSDTLTRLREQMADLLDQYGFSGHHGQWQPHIPIARVRGTQADLEVPSLSDQAKCRFSKISLFGHGPTDSAKRGGRPLVSVDVARLTRSAKTDSTEEEAVDGIRQELNVRLAELNAAFSTSRRRKKPRIEDAEPTDDDSDRDDEADDGDDDN